MENQVALVTGAGSGIGRAIAQALLREGARVALMGRREDRLRGTAAGFAEDQTLCCACDVSDRGAVQAMVQQIVDRFGAVTLLVNNAGINTIRRSLAEVDPSDWDRTIGTNLTGAFNCVRAVLPGMRRRGDGLIVNIASISAKKATRLAGAPYSASKHGMLALTHSINDEEGPHGIRSTAICPGEVDTEILDYRPQPVPAEQRERILKAEDVAAVVLFVSSLPPRVCVPEILILPRGQPAS